jgi:hypothetical protein
MSDEAAILLQPIGVVRSSLKRRDEAPVRPLS